MKPAYRNTRFKAEMPAGPLPDAFSVITPCNPDGETVPEERNRELLQQFEQRLDELGLPHFKVDGGSPDFEHVEPGFGIETTLAKSLNLGREWRQEAIFWVEKDVIHLIASSGDEREVIGKWSDFVRFLPEDELPSS